MVGEEEGEAGRREGQSGTRAGEEYDAPNGGEGRIPEKKQDRAERDEADGQRDPRRIVPVLVGSPARGREAGYDPGLASVVANRYEGLVGPVDENGPPLSFHEEAGHEYPRALDQ